MQLFRWIKNIIFGTLFALLVVCGFYACASIGTPSGGDYDIEPPLFLRSNPLPNATHFEANRINLYFDEFLTLENPAEKVIVTPPQMKSPVIKAIGKRISIELLDSLIPNTTYTFDFTDAIVDNNEKNALEGFTFAFSTGDVVDSLVISGIVLNAENLEPMPNIIVGLHSDLADSAFKTTTFKRTSMTNDRGRFWIRNVAPGEYRLYALKDMNRDYKFDQPGEAIAFYDEIITPAFEPAMRQDTIWVDSLTIDTILDVKYTRFTPDNVTLRLFKEDFINQYLIRGDRYDEKKFKLSFNHSIGLPPKIKLLNLETKDDWYLSEYVPKDSIVNYWITDSLVYKQDTLRLAVDFTGTDSLFNLVPTSDTLRILFRNRPKPKNNDKDDKKSKKAELLNVEINTKGTLEVYDTLKFTFSEPVLNFTKNNIRFQQRVDTVWQDREINIYPDSLNPRLYYSDFKFGYNREFQLFIDSAQVTGVYGHHTDSLHFSFKVKKEEEYGHLYVNILGIDPIGFGQLLSHGDKVVRESKAINGELIFENLKPGKYYLRYIDDTNGNGKWDTGYYDNKEQPEAVYYFNSFFEIREFGEHEENWNVKNIPIERQKPLEIIKNKPKEKRQKRDEKGNIKDPDLSGSNPTFGF